MHIFIGFDQFLFVVISMRYVEFVTSTRTHILTVITWSSSILIRILTYFLYSTTSFQSFNHSSNPTGFESQTISLISNPNTSLNISTLQPQISSSVMCKDDERNDFFERNAKLFIGINFLVTFLFPTLAIVGFYAKIWLVARNSIKVCF